MSAFLIFQSEIKDPKKFKTYAQSVPPTLKPFGGALLAKGKTARVFAGRGNHSTVGIFKFPDLD